MPRAVGQFQLTSPAKKQNRRRDDEIAPAVQRAVLAGARQERPVSTYKWGKLALMADPFGHGFCFVQFLGRGYDEIAE